MGTTIEGIADRYEHWADQLANRWDKPEEHIPFKEQIKRAFIAGAKYKHAELTRWHDPKEPPEPGRVVLVKRNPSSIIPYDLGHIDNDGNWVDSWCGSPIDDKIIGWREIHE